MRSWSHIVIHHSLTKDGPEVSWGAIRDYHLSLGWSDNGYHAGVERARGAYEVMLGRPLDCAGAHTKQEGMNMKALGICFIGNYDLGAPPREMLMVAVRRFIVPAMKIFNIQIENIHPHRKFALYKSCPGKQFPWVDFIHMIADQINPSDARTA